MNASHVTEPLQDKTALPGIDFDELAEKLPPELEPHWIAEVVRSFGKYRSTHDDHDLMDTWLVATEAAVNAAHEAGLKGGDVTAFVKRAVISRLTDCQRSNDIRASHITVMSECPEKKAVRPLGDFKVAMMLVSRASQRVWRAYRLANGNVSDMARRLNTTGYLVSARLLPRLCEEFRCAWTYVRAVRGKTLAARGR